MNWKFVTRSFANAKLSTPKEKIPKTGQEQQKEERSRLDKLSDRILRKFVKEVVRNRPLKS